MNSIEYQSYLSNEIDQMLKAMVARNKVETTQQMLRVLHQIGSQVT